MADYKVTIHHKHMTAIGRGWSVTAAIKAAVNHHSKIDGATEDTRRECWEMAKTARACKQGFVGLISMTVPFPPYNFVKLERI